MIKEDDEEEREMPRLNGFSKQEYPAHILLDRVFHTAVIDMI